MICYKVNPENIVTKYIDNIYFQITAYIVFSNLYRNHIFNPFSHFTIVYIDDVLIFFKSIEEHWKHLNLFFKTIKLNGLVLSPSKCVLFQTKIRFLGHNIQFSKIQPIDRAIQFADKFPDEILDKTQL